MSSWFPRRLTPWWDWKYALSLERFCSQSSTKGISGLLFFPTAISHTISLVADRENYWPHPAWYMNLQSWRALLFTYMTHSTLETLHLVYQSNEVVGISGMKHLWDNRLSVGKSQNNRSWNCRPHSLSSSIEIWTGLSIVCNTLDARPWMRDYFFPEEPSGFKTLKTLGVCIWICLRDHTLCQQPHSALLQLYLARSFKVDLDLSVFFRGIWNSFCNLALACPFSFVCKWSS